MNMSYCRFQNTTTDLRDCAAALEELLHGGTEPLSRDEMEAAKSLAAQALDILHLFADAAGKQIEDIEESDIDAALDEANADAAKAQAAEATEEA